VKLDMVSEPMTMATEIPSSSQFPSSEIPHTEIPFVQILKIIHLALLRHLNSPLILPFSAILQVRFTCRTVRVQAQLLFLNH
jgi:hypothetical protein